MAGTRPWEMTALWQAQVSDWANALSWSARGDLLAVGAADGVVTVFDSKTGQIASRFEAHDGPVTALDWHPKRERLATAGEDGLAKLWLLDAGEEVVELEGDDFWVEHVAWSPDGSALASASGKVVRFWDEQGLPLGVSEPMPSAITAIAWAHAEATLAACSFGAVALLKPDTGEPRAKFRLEEAFISLSWSPDDEVLAAGRHDGAVQFWRLRQRPDPSMMSGYPRKPLSISWNHTGRFMATSGADSTLTWDFGAGPEGTAPFQQRLHDANVTHVAFAHRGMRLAVGHDDGAIVTWLTPYTARAPGVSHIEGAEITGLAWSHQDKALAVISSDGQVVAFDGTERPSVVIPPAPEV